MIDFAIGQTIYQMQTMLFPAGEVGVQISSYYGDPDNVRELTLQATLRNSEEVMALLMTSDALKRKFKNAKINAILPYIPYARQDRVCNDGESLSVKVVAGLINSCGFNCVTTYDPHSDVLPALLDNVEIVSQSEMFMNVKVSWEDWHIVAPDAGALKKTFMFAETVGAAGVISCEKKRDLKTGRILGLRCREDVTDKNLFVLDDICDGGRTFTELSTLLWEPARKLELGVTHGIFSKGQQIVANCYDRVYTTNSYHGGAFEVAASNLTLLKI